MLISCAFNVCALQLQRRFENVILKREALLRVDPI